MFSELYLYSIGEKKAKLSSHYFFLQHSYYCILVTAILSLPSNYETYLRGFIMVYSCVLFSWICISVKTGELTISLMSSELPC